MFSPRNAFMFEPNYNYWKEANEEEYWWHIYDAKKKHILLYNQSSSVNLKILLNLNTSLSNFFKAHSELIPYFFA
jgi:hypothetical protein